MTRIGIITNPHSKLNKRKPETPQLLSYILGEQGQLEITHSLSDLELAAKNFFDSNIEILAINGGDGTISRTISAFIKVYQDQKPLPKIALLRGGTMNVLASNLNIRGSTESILYNLIEGYTAGRSPRIKTITSLRLDDHYGFLYADGFAVRFLKEYYRNKTNALGAAWCILKLICSALVNGKLARSIIYDEELIIEHDNQSLSLTSLGVFASSLTHISFKVKIFPDAQKHNKMFQFFAVRCTARSLVWKLPQLILFRRARHYKIKYSALGSELLVKTPGKPFIYSLDGEIHQSSQDNVRISIGPDIQFISYT